MPNTASTLLGGIIIHEVLSDPSGAAFNFDTDRSGSARAGDEFIELYNTSEDTIDISGLQLWDAAAGNWFTIPNGSLLESRKYAYIVSGTSGGTLPKANSTTLVFDAGLGNSGVFNNSGDNIVLLDPNADEYVQLTYNGAAADSPVTYAGFSPTAALVGTVEDWGTTTDGVSLVRDPSSSANVINQTDILSAAQGQPTATPGYANVGGTENNDTIIGTSTPNVLRGGAGNDTISGANGNDKLFGNDGNDTLFGGANNDLIFGGLGVDVLYGESGRDKLRGQAGMDDLYGGSGNDDIRGGSGRDSLTGESGNDRLQGQAGDDFLNGGGTNVGERDFLIGGSGADTFVLGVAGDVLYDNGGADRAIIRDFDFSEGDVIQLSGSASDYQLQTVRSTGNSRIVLNSTSDIIAVFANDVSGSIDLSAGIGVNFV